MYVLNENSFVVDNKNIILDICWNNKKVESCILTAGFRPNQNADRRSGFVPSEREFPLPCSGVRREAEVQDTGWVTRTHATMT